MVGINVSSYSEYKVKNGLSWIEQFRNFWQNGTSYYTVFDEWKDILMYGCVCDGSEPEYSYTDSLSPKITCKILHKSSVARFPANKFVRAHADY